MNARTGLALLCLMVMAGSCVAPEYLPKVSALNVNPYGSYVRIFTGDGHRVEGELFAADVNGVVVNTMESRLVSVPRAKITGYFVRYAKPKKYGWTIPLFTFYTLSHGVWLIITAPVNLITTLSVTVGGAYAFTYDEKNLSYDQLSMFARFPQGLPAEMPEKKGRW